MRLSLRGRRQAPAAAVPPAPAAPSAAAGFAAQVDAGVDQLRVVARWMIGALGASGAVLLAGVQLTSLGAASTSHLVVAGVALAVALGATVVAILFLTRVLRTVLMDPAVLQARAAESTTSLARFLAAQGWLFLPPGLDTVAALVSRVRADQDAPPPEPDELERARGRRRSLRELLLLATWFEVDDAFVRARRALVVSALLVAAGAATFAWAANPPAEEPAASPAVPARPVEVRLLLTADGRDTLAGVVGAACAAAASTPPGVRALATDADATSTTVLLVPGGACTTPHRLRISLDQGSATSTTAVAPAGQ